ncbi:MAG: hypothetical protein JAY97_12305, partial [Candidatus Thiodiazotropha sp. 'RUGA']|nr:hypothetical protein [Candidatus Thiodiazotropha sp. 'RUGA']
DQTCKIESTHLASDSTGDQAKARLTNPDNIADAARQLQLPDPNSIGPSMRKKGSPQAALSSTLCETYLAATRAVT